VLFTLALVAMLAMAGLLIDGGMAWVNRRQAQAAADTAALAAAVAISNSASVAEAQAAAIAAGWGIAGDNGYKAGNKDCDGHDLIGDNEQGGVTVNWPSTAPAHSGLGFVEVFVTRAMPTSFAGVVGQPCWMVSAHAVAQLPTPKAICSFCAITPHHGDGEDHVLSIDNGGHLRVDGPVGVNGAHLANPATCAQDGAFGSCGKALELFHTGGGDVTVLSAPSITVSGGWFSLAATRARADAPNDSLYSGAGSCTAPAVHRDPRVYGNESYPYSNVCIGAAPFTDPFNPNPMLAIQPPDAFTTPVATPGQNGCPDFVVGSTVIGSPGTAGFPAKLNLTQSTPGGPNFTICPGLYPGGFSVFSGFGTPVHVNMLPGVYIMVGGGFKVSGAASIDGSAGVMIYNTTGSYSLSAPTAPWAGTLPVPPCDGACTNLTTASLAAVAFADVEVPKTYTVTLTAPSTPNPTGTVTFYDGDDPITATDPDSSHTLGSCEAVTPLVPVGTTQAKASCVLTYHGFGSHWITAVYAGDSHYASASANTKTVVNPKAPLEDSQSVVDICTGAACGASANCDVAGSCKVLLSAPKKDQPYAGMLIFQDRQQNLGIRLWPAVGLPACVGVGDPPPWMTAGVPGGPNPLATPPDPCGALGGLSGTVYAPHSRSIGPDSDHDATVQVQADGAANLQIVAGRITFAYETNARLLFNSEDLAGGTPLHLVQ
jgi:hypothetical protein